MADQEDGVLGRFEAPLPKRMLVGGLSDTPRVLAALDIGEPSSQASRTAGG